MEHFLPNSGEGQKKGLPQKWNTFFPKFMWTFTLRCTLQSNYWGDADVDQTQTIGGDTVKLLGGYIPLSRVSAPLPTNRLHLFYEMLAFWENIAENHLCHLQIFRNLSNCNYRIFVKEILLNISFIEIGYIS